VITNPVAFTVLCYGDSNTHGIVSDGENHVRLPADVRWTGRLQRLLGDGYYVIEEGLNGRTTDLEYDDRPGCNGRPYFKSCLQSHHPLDVVVVMLGSNDLKTRFERSPAAVAAALNGYIDDAESYAGEAPRIILMCPVPLDDSRPAFAEMTGANFDATAVDKSKRLPAEIRRVAEARDVLFADAAAVAHVGADGLHLSADSHARIAELVAGRLKEARPNSR